MKDGRQSEHGARTGLRRVNVKAYLDILKLVWPLALGMVNNAAMQFADRAFLANESMASLEAILPATTLAWVFLGFFQSVVSYSGVFVAQYRGAGDAAGCVRSYRAGLGLAALSALFLLPLVPLGDWIFRLTATSPALAARESVYYDIVLWGGFFLMGQMAVTAYFTGCGRTRIIFWVNLLGNILNVALDPLLIFGVDLTVPSFAFASRLHLHFPALGIAGAAYATVFSQAVQFAVLAVAARREIATVRKGASRDERALTLGLLGRMLRFGVPSGGQSILDMASFTIFIFITGRMDDVSFAASNTCFTVNYLLFAPMLGFSIGAQTLVGQARGRGDDAGAMAATARTWRLALAFLLIVFVLVFAFHRPLLRLFTPPEMAVDGAFASMGVRLLALMGVWIFFDATDIILVGALKGAGDTRFVFWWMFVTSFLVWLPLVALACAFHATMPVLWSTLIVFILIITTGSWIRWHRGKWRGIVLLDFATSQPRSKKILHLGSCFERKKSVSYWQSCGE